MGPTHPRVALTVCITGSKLPGSTACFHGFAGVRSKEPACCQTCQLRNPRRAVREGLETLGKGWAARLQQPLLWSSPSAHTDIDTTTSVPEVDAVTVIPIFQMRKQDEEGSGDLIRVTRGAYGRQNSNQMFIRFQSRDAFVYTEEPCKLRGRRVWESKSQAS